MSDEVKQAAKRLREMRRRWSEGDVFAEQSVCGMGDVIQRNNNIIAGLTGGEG